MLDDRPNCHKVLDQHVWREIEIKMAALQAKRKTLAIFAILELLEDDKIPRKKTKRAIGKRNENNKAYLLQLGNYYSKILRGSKR